jgi:NADH dehydrogenase/NADH:ubiquinone oxidoreductase subunit G
MLLTIDDTRVEAREGQTLWEVAAENGIEIPTLCHHEALEPRGACRICMVEISNPKWPGWSRLVTSCVYPAEPGLVVRTNNDEIHEIRRTIVDLLMARCPETGPVLELGAKYGLTESSFVKREQDDNCILCGLCVRTCEDVIGACAIGVSGRGAIKKVGPAFGVGSKTCIGCGACAHVCPTGCIQVIDEGGKRRIPRWGVEFELVRCPESGMPVSTREHIEFVRKRVSVGREVLETAPEMKRKFYARKVASEGHM